MRVFYNHPGSIAANADRVREALAQLAAGRTFAPRLHRAQHPVGDGSGVPLRGSARESAGSWPRPSASTDTGARLPEPERPPQDPWLEPDILDHLRDVAAQRRDGRRDLPDRLPLRPSRGPLRPRRGGRRDRRRARPEHGPGSDAGTHPAFVAMIRELIEERLGLTPERRAVGRYAASHDICPIDCCLPGSGRPSPWAVAAG